MHLRIRVHLSVAALLLGSLPTFAQEQVAGATAKKRPTLGLVLQGGGALGLAHVGVITWLEEHHIPVNYVAGTSMGGLVGGVYATGRNAAEVREVVNGIFYILWTGCQWKALPKDLPPKSTVHDYLELWNWDGTLQRIHHELYVAVREHEGREPSPTVAIIDSQTAKSAQKGGLGSILQATTRARRSRVASGTSWSTRWASC